MLVTDRSARSGNRRVLLVDGNAHILELLVILLQHYGYEVATAAGGAEALCDAIEFRPDVIFTGTALPDCSGYDLAPQLRRLPGCENCVLVALTGYGQKDDFKGRQAAGFDHFILKPANIEDIVATLNRFKSVAAEVQR